MPQHRLVLCSLLLALTLRGAASQLTHNGAKQRKECPDICDSCMDDGSCESCAPGAMQVGTPSPSGAVTCVKCKDPLCEECGPTPDKCKSCFSFWSYSQPDFTDGMEDWPVYQATDGRCRVCTNNPLSSGCYECDQSGRCLYCVNTILVGGVCKKCKGDSYCVDCNPTTLECTKCPYGSGLDAKKNCRPCAKGLDEYGQPACTECNADFRVCKECARGLYVDTRGQCSRMPKENCAVADRKGVCMECDQFYVLAAQTKTCLPCSTDCRECVIISPGSTRCTKCDTLTLINGVCRRCDDPRCADCSGDASRCKACRKKAHVVNSATGRCQDPSWPAPCRQQAGGAGRRGCVPPQTPKPKTAQAGRRLHAASSGVGPRPAIYNGANATRGRFPYIVSHRVHAGATHSCGGSLVHERVVLTAAHCILDDLAWASEDKVFAQVRIGGYERDGGSYEARRVKWAVVHPSVEEPGGHTVNDFALLLLDRPSTKRPLLRLPPAVPRPAAAAGTPLTVIGWGVARDDWASYNPTVLQQATIEMMALKDCVRYFQRMYPKEKWDAQFCAGPPAKRTDTCQGDSGGPLLLKSPAGPAGDLAVGVVSWGIGCAEQTPGVYADVASASQWIKNTIQWLVLEDAAGRIPGPATKNV